MKLNIIWSICWLICLVLIFFIDDKKALRFMAIFSTISCIILMLTEVVK